MNHIFYFFRKIKIILVLVTLLIYSCGSGDKKPDIPKIPDTVNIDTTKINIYIENSISMDGFVNKGNEFTNSVSSYLTDISISFPDNINLFYINSIIIPLGKDIIDFTSKLDASSFKCKGGKRDETHIFQLLDTILKLTDDNKISIFITDGIFSPGKGKDAQKYITDQYNGIKTSMAAHLIKYPNSAVVIYQLSSQFDGTFYDRNDNKIPNTKEELPYYIWLIGNRKSLDTLITKVPENKFKESGVQESGVQNIFSITAGNKSVDYAVKMGSGDFHLDKKEPKTTIENLKKDTRGKQNTARFSVRVNLSGFLLDEDYLKDTNNYELKNKDYSLTISKAGSFGYTHQLNFESDRVHKGNISVKLKSKIPQWVEELNDSIGTEAVKGKTYGIKYQIQGIYGAFTNTNNYYTEIKIKIN